MSRHAFARRFGWLLAGSLTTACGGRPSSPAAPDAGPSFVATQGSFAHFTSWESFDGGTTADDSLNLVGQRILYLNQRPPHGSTQFPIGTIIVKTTQGGATFAMARRGGGFNPQGLGWEWFQLATGADGTPTILWRGDGTSGMLAYGTTSATGCNDCHFEAIDNDYVQGDSILLSNF